MLHTIHEEITALLEASPAGFLVDLQTAEKNYPIPAEVQAVFNRYWGEADLYKSLAPHEQKALAHALINSQRLSPAQMNYLAHGYKLKTLAKHPSVDAFARLLVRHGVSQAPFGAQDLSQHPIRLVRGYSLTDETYGPESHLYFTVPPGSRREWERILDRAGFTINFGYDTSGSTIDVRIAFFKGDKWDEAREAPQLPVLYDSKTLPTLTPVPESIAVLAGIAAALDAQHKKNKGERDVAPAEEPVEPEGPNKKRAGHYERHYKNLKGNPKALAKALQDLHPDETKHVTTTARNIGPYTPPSHRKLNDEQLAKVDALHTIRHLYPDTFAKASVASKK